MVSYGCGSNYNKVTMVMLGDDCGDNEAGGGVESGNRYHW